MNTVHTPNTKISIRQTKRGDWLVFEARPAFVTDAAGQLNFGTPMPGFTTGPQHGRFDTSEEAAAFADGLCATNGWERVDWEFPKNTNIPYALPRLYPERTDYATWEEAQADGWVRIAVNKTIARHNGHSIYVVDVTPGRSFGYDLAIRVKGDPERQELARTEQVWCGSKLAIVFRAGEVMDAISAGKSRIEQIDWEASSWS